MDITGGLLSSEITRISSTTPMYRVSLKAIVRAGPEEVEAIAVTRLDIGSNFEKSYRDDITLTLLLPFGALVNKIGPYQDDITIVVKEIIVGKYGFTEAEYKAYLVQDIPNDFETSADPSFSTEEGANRTGGINISFYLTHPLVEYLDSMTTGTIVRQVPPFSVLKVLFDKYVDEINFAVDEGINSITMVEPSNFEPRDQIVIPHNTKLVQLPMYLQDHQGGIYSTGMGFYLSGRDLHFWPLYDVDRNEEMKSRLHVYMPVSKHTKMIDSTFKKEGGLVSVIVSGSPRVIDDSLSKTYHEGDSIRYVDGNTAFDPIGVSDDGILKADRSKRMIEAGVTTTGKRINTITGGSSRVTSNIYSELSKKAKNDGIYLALEWRYSTHYIIKPGMLTTIFMNVNNEIREIPAIVVGLHTQYELEGEGLGVQNMVPSSVITLFVKRIDWRMDKFLKSNTQRSIQTTK